MKFKKSTYLPIALLLYTLVMAYFGRDMLENGGKAEYLITLGISLLIILLLHFVLKKKEKSKDRDNKDLQQNDNSLEN